MISTENVSPEPAQRSERYQSLIVVLLIVAAVIVAADAWLAFRAEETLSQSEAMVSHTWQVITGVEVLVGSMKDAETGSRGYVLSGDPSFLAPYLSSEKEMPAELTDLTRLTNDNPVQQRRLEEMTTVAARRLGILQRVVAMEQGGDSEGAIQMIRSGSGAGEMGRMRAIASDMNQEEQRLLKMRLAVSSRARVQARLTVLVASLLDALFIVLTFFSLRYERNLRRLATGNSERLRKLQVISDVGLTQLSLGELSSEMLARLRTVADADAVVLCDFVGRGMREAVHILAADGVPLEVEERVPILPDGPLDRSAREHRVLKLSGDELRTMPILPLRREMGTLLIVPLAAEREVTALLIAGRRRANAFSDEDEHLFSVVADRIARAIDRARIYDAEREARQLAERSMAEVQLLNEELEHRVHLRTKELEATNSELEAFSYSVSHDLRAPLRSVDGFSVALAEDYGDAIPADGKHYLARIRAGVQRMGQLIDALLQLSRITRAELAMEQVDLSQVAEESAAELQQLHPGRALHFEIQAGLVARGDPKLLRVVFDNMFGNAVKFTANREDARIEFGLVSSDDLGGTKTYYIRDNGAGFDQQYAGKLFNAFQRLHGEKDFSGSGIGLATVSRVIRRHQGTLRAEGVVGGGATFWFTLG